MAQNRQENTQTLYAFRGDSSKRLYHFLTLASVALVYFGAAKLGLSLAFIHVNVSPVWPPTGIAIAAVLLLGLRVWPGIFIGAFLANIITNVPFATAGGIAVGNTLEALAAAYLLHRLDFKTSLDYASDVFKFLVAAFLCTMFSATIGNVSLCLGGAAKWEDFGTLWLTWWLGDSMGALIVSPLLLTWATDFRKWFNFKRLIEVLVLLALLAIASLAMFGGPSQIPLKYYPLARLVVPFFLIAAFRLGPRGVTIATIMMSIVAVSGTSRGFGPFVDRTPNESLLVLQLFLGSNVAMFLFLASAIEDRRRATDTLRESERRIAANLAISQILVESPQFHDATRRILETIGNTLGWDVGGMWIPNPEGTELRCMSFWHASSSEVREFKVLCLNRTFDKGEGLPGSVWQTGKPIWIPDVGKSDNFPRASTALAEGLHSGFAFPIMFGNTFLGVMEFFSREVREPDHALLATFGGIGNQIGQFVERKRAEDEREHLLKREHNARAEAEQANRTKDEFLAVVSHELRTPLNAIVGWAGMLRDGSLDVTSSRRAIEVIDRNARAQAQLIEDLLDVSRIVSGNLRIEPRPVHLQPVIEAAIDSIRPAADSKRITLEMSLDPNSRNVSGDPERLQQVVWNLLSNAVKFTPPEGQIDVCVVGSNSHVEIIISDTGQGISVEFLPHVFDSFRQADGSKTRRHGGLGLGLAIVRNLVELHGGRVTAHSAGEGKGTAFKIDLPCIGDEELQVQSRSGSLDASSKESGLALAGLKILSVDDDPDSREMLEIILRSQGADVVTVGSVRDAIMVLKSNEWRPEVLLSDLGMPNNDGYDLIRELRSWKPDEGSDLPAIAISGYAGKQEAALALEAGYHEHLTKPISWDVLIQAISEISTREAH